MSSNDRMPYYIEEKPKEETSNKKPVELRKKPTLSVTWEKAKELFELE